MNYGRANRRALTLLAPTMLYRLRDDLYYCSVNDRVVFMDIRNDAYFMLRDKLERAFSRFINDPHVPQADLDLLLAQGLLTEEERNSSQETFPLIPIPSRSVAEGMPLASRTRARTVLEVACTVYSTKRRLRTRKIGQIIKDHLAYCRTNTTARVTGAPEEIEERLMEAAGEYARARRHVPIDTSCLLDSLSMHRFLARRHLSANIVFGITVEPFSAHSWLQAGDLALNESVSYASTHTPILVL